MKAVDKMRRLGVARPKRCAAPGARLSARAMERLLHEHEQTFRAVVTVPIEFA
jgi:hypothetical protein